MPPIVPAKRAAGTPLAPSVEKAYYRKCIQLKRRLNEVAAANEEARIRRVRLDRAIMKMRLERAFLLEQLSKRVEPNIEGSDASDDEGAVGTPPADRPHRDKRRRTQHDEDPSSHPQHPPTHQSSSGGNRGIRATTDGKAESSGVPPNPYTANSQELVKDEDRTPINHENGVVGEGLGAGPTIREGQDGERRIVSGGGAADSDS
ncbi:hypothetical protein Q7P37_007952 [Cladosporium fusiforme]